MAMSCFMACKAQSIRRHSYAYFTSIGHLQNVAPEVSLGADGAPARAQCCRQAAEELAERAVQIHKEIDGMVASREADAERFTAIAPQA